MSRKPPSLESLLNKTPRDKPVAFVLAGHNGSGKSTLWRERLSDALRIPLINADRMMLSILPEPDTTGSGHDVDVSKLVSRFPRTQAAVAAAATVADMAVMFDNSREEVHAFTLVRARMRRVVMFDARDPRYSAEVSLRNACDPWLENVVGPFKLGQSSK